jgi:hypothetical protein
MVRFVTAIQHQATTESCWGFCTSLQEGDEVLLFNTVNSKTKGAHQPGAVALCSVAKGVRGGRRL